MSSWVAVVAVMASCDRARDAAEGSESATRRTVERGETFFERKSERTQDLLRDSLDRLERRVGELRKERPLDDARDEIDEAMDAVDTKRKQLDGRLEDLQKRADGAGDDVKRELAQEWRELERELERLQSSLDNLEHEMRAPKRH